MKREELQLYYQPQLDIRSGKIIGAEALLRWNHPLLGMISPEQFIPIAEQSGLIIPIGEWVLRRACTQSKVWIDAGLPDFVVSINLSPLQFVQLNFIEMIRTILADTGMNPENVDLEITESMTLDVDKTIEVLGSVKQLGVRISMDDFGKGYSCLHYLKRFPLDTLKIDRSFVSECTIDDNDAVIVKTIISMAHHLHLQVIAEGVETNEQLLFLRQNLCDKAQGYLFSKPIPAEELERLFPEIGRLLGRNGAALPHTEKLWKEEQLRHAMKELEETLRKQEGLTFKIKQLNGRFIHTLCEGELFYRFGHSPDQMIGKEIHELFPPSISNSVHEHYVRAWRGEKGICYEIDVYGVWIIVTLRAVRRGGKIVEVIGSCIDISERKRAEDELKAMTEQLNYFIENNADAICITDSHHKVTRVNAMFESMFGWGAMEICGDDLPALPYPMRDEEELIRKRIQAGETITGIETIRRHKDGHLLDVSLAVTPIRDSQGTIIATASVYRQLACKGANRRRPLS
ncbi:EAL domain-containing protein [Paenibacillus silviterrae]|uniref:EAL domain-containing protein n=1 Tax=Paenibacillus silviterrae TaxID=3242194 RepID=UPI002543242B|nr:EAL domain-containing protein [Paenibacillus chinjuensis]